ncbi:MAG: outer membrane protein assembly factor BamD [Nitrospirae bacterium]|nr:MAG: outer membrane protein assembly factor BamD [Nitrospirota bacterium]
MKLKVIMRLSAIFLFVVFVFFLTGCGSNAAELFETAKFEELQNNKEHAVKLYEEIVNKYPDSDYADRAKERLARLKAAQK